MKRDYGNEVPIEFELEDDYYVKGWINKNELKDLKEGNIGSVLLHGASGTMIISYHDIINFKEVQYVS